MILKNIGIILTPTFRAMAYLQRLIKNNMHPSFAIVMGRKNKDYLSGINKENTLHFFDKFKDSKVTLNKYNIPYKEINTGDCNDDRVIEVIRSRDEKYFIYTGGGILKEGILSLGKKIIHVHPGIVPQYRGSTCMYYSIINEDKCGATAFFMVKKIDEGEVIAKRFFKKPGILNIDYEYDCHIRSALLVEIMNQYIKKGKFDSSPQNLEKGETYHIIHPVLKHLAILSCVCKKHKI
jgi:methionyl-tRNA formyltransferase|tara:strand:- start:93 stop:800 length:708 start_codon:yes stop_codon:yes gene_type:complete